MVLTLNQVKQSSYDGDLPNFLIDQYHDTTFLAIQQMDTRIPGFFTPDSIEVGHKQKWIPFAKAIDGDSGYADTVANKMVTGIANDPGTEIREVSANSRYGETRNEYQETYKRRVTTKRFEYNPLIERVDEKLLFGNPNSWIYTNVQAAYRRKQEDICIDAFDASVSEGFDDSNGDFSETMVTFPTTQIIDDTGSEAMTWDKILQALELFRDNEVDTTMEMPVLVCGPRQHKNLLDQEKIINFDYTAARNLEKIQMDRLPNGIPIIVTTRLSAANSIRDCFLWMPSGMMYVVEEQFYQSVATRHDRRDATQIRTEHASGAVRLYDEKVIKIKCAEVAQA